MVGKIEFKKQENGELNKGFLNSFESKEGEKLIFFWEIFWSNILNCCFF